MTAPTLLVALALVYWLFLASRLSARLRERHPETWARLGAPSRWLLPTPAAALRFLGFVLGGGYRGLEDARFTRLCGFLRLFGVLIGVGLAASVVWSSAAGGPRSG